MSKVTPDGRQILRLDRAICAARRERDATILRRSRDGESHAGIGRSYGLTRQRVGQIVQRCTRAPRAIRTHDGSHESPG